MTPTRAVAGPPARRRTPWSAPALALGLLAGCAETPGTPPAAPGDASLNRIPPGAAAAPPPTSAGQAACARLTVSAVHRGVRDRATGLMEARLRVSSAAEGALITLIEPYYGGLYDDVLSNITVLPTNARPLAFVSDLSPGRSAEEYDQRLTVSWLGRLELLVDAGGCDPVRILCDATACTVG